MKERRYEYQPPRPLPPELAALSGHALMTRIARGEWDAPPIAATLDFTIAETGEGFAAFEGTPAEWMYNPLGTVHGGWIATLLDSALGCAVHTTLPPQRGYTTATLELKMLRPITVKTGRVRAEARVVHGGNRTATAEGKLVSLVDGKLLATATTTCILL